ncbi:dTDP-4-dehydrorhamnose 3,5-epimerase family protein [Burkholderia sp. ABCPW 11]
MPEEFAHGLAVISDAVEFLYKTTDYWYPDAERAIRWDDPMLVIE